MGGGIPTTGGMGGGGGFGGCCWPSVGTAVTSIGGGTVNATAVTGGPNLLTLPDDVDVGAVVVVGEATPPSFLSQGILPTSGAAFLLPAAAESPATFWFLTPWPQAIATEGRAP
jgi:hypothetical protein